MGLRVTSIRQRILLLVLVPVLSLIGLYAFATSITAGQAINLARTDTLKTETGQPAGNFFGAVGTERPLGLVYLARPTAASLAALKGAEAKTAAAAQAMRAALTSTGTTGNESRGEKAAISVLLADAARLPAFNAQVESQSISRAAAFSRYNKITNDGDEVLNQAILQQGNPQDLTQSLAFVRAGRSEEMLSREYALLASDLAAGSFPAADRVLFTQLTGARRTLYSENLNDLATTYQALYTRAVTPQALASLKAAENRVITAPARPARLSPVQFGAFQQAFGVVSAGMTSAATQAGTLLASHASQHSRVIYLRLIIAGGVGLLAVLLSILVSVLVGRGLVRELAGLRGSAEDLASRRLPEVIQRLRDGEEVEAAADQPAVTAKTAEIRQVGEALAIAGRTAVEAAAGEARLRRGVSDIFRNLARRSQSLLHRQLALLDAMERRADAPDELEDLFRIDHLTTRMRRHAESLIILSGDAPARGWRHPVPLVDVLRAAVAEVEDYTRIRVTSASRAALAGPAVGDIIHLIAELVENAAIFSPPNTPVLVGGDVVGRGFAVEIEDRGLGMTEEQRAAINARLADPPPFDLSGSDQLGLFVAGQLAQRHGVQISLRPSPYGGTTAIVLIPRNLVVPETEAGREAGQLTGRAGPAGELGQERHTGSPARLADPAPWPGDPVGQAGSPGPASASLLTADPASGSPRAGPASDPPGGEQARPGPVPDEAAGARQDGDLDRAASPADLTGELLPRRVRQASLAPQLRPPAGDQHETAGSTAPGAATPGAAAPDAAPGGDADRSPDETRATMSAIQQGWQQGRSVFDVPDRGQPAANGTPEAGTSRPPGKKK